MDKQVNIYMSPTFALEGINLVVLNVRVCVMYGGACGGVMYYLKNIYNVLQNWWSRVRSPVWVFLSKVLHMVKVLVLVVT